MERKWVFFVCFACGGFVVLVCVFFFWRVGKVGLFFFSFFVACVVEGMHFDTQCLLDFLRH